MLIQWRYKIVRKFGKMGDAIMDGDRLNRIEHTKPYPDRFFLYRVSKRKYDYVDYSGIYKDVDTNLSDLTALLEFLGYIKYVDSKSCDEGVFK